MQEPNDFITLSREFILQNPNLLEALHRVFPREDLINWILKKAVEQKKEEAEKEK